MHWVLNTNFYSEPGYVKLLDMLQRLDKKYTIVRKPPFADYLVSLDSDTPIDVDIPNPVFVTGATSMNLISQKYGWNPGYITAPSQATLKEWWGDELLNSDARFGTLESIETPSDEFFARPVEDTKSFAGTIFSRDEWNTWRDAVVVGQNDLVTLKPTDSVMLAPLKKIYAEYRVFVVCGLVVTASRYKLGSRVLYSSDVDKPMLDYAQHRLYEAESYINGVRGITLHAGPRDSRLTFALDIADTPDGYKVIETNSISSSGFYECDMGKFVQAIGWLK
jgi:hypothetical protein